MNQHKIEVAIDRLIQAVGKRRSEEYTQLFAYVPQQLAQKFRTLCTQKRLEHSEVIERLLQEWVLQEENEG